METPSLIKYKWAIITNIVIFIIGVLSCLLLFMFDDARKQIPSVLCFFAGFQGVAIIIALSLYAQIEKKWSLDVTGVIEKKKYGKDKFISYSNIQAIVVSSAVNSYFCEIRDKSGVPKSLIVLYDNLKIAQCCTRPDSSFVLPAIPLDGVLSYNFFSIDVLEVLVDKTDAPVLIAHLTYVTNKDILDSFFAQRKNRVFISVPNNDMNNNCELIPYSNL